MAQVVEVDYNLTDIPGAWGGDIPSPGPRSPGPHVSGIIRSIDDMLIHQGQRPLDAELSPEELRRMGNYREMGFIWEQVFTEIFAKRMKLRLDGIHQQEIERDGVFGTPDWIALSPWRVVDFKATWRSAKRVVNLQEDFRTWFMQLKAYCMMMRTARAVLYIFFVNGDYASSGPQIRQFDIIFGMKELVDNWNMMLNHNRKHT